jgi:hypothetical protein
MSPQQLGDWLSTAMQVLAKVVKEGWVTGD